MKQLYIFLIFTLFSSLLFSQQEKVQEWVKQSQEATSINEKLDLYEKVIRRAYTYRMSEANKYLDSLCLLSEEHKILDKQSFCLQMRGVFKSKKHKFEDSNEYFFDALEIAKQIKDSAQVLQLYYNLGNNYSEIGKNDSTRYYYEKIIKSTEDPKLLAKTYNQFGRKYYNILDSLGKSVIVFQKAIDYSKIAKDTIKESRGLLSLGQMYFQIGNYDKSISILKDALKINTVNSSTTRTLGANYAILGEVYIEQKDFQKANISFFSALDAYRKAEDKFSEAAVLNKLGWCFLNSNELDKGLKYTDSSKEILSKYKRKLTIDSDNLLNEGLYAIEKGNYARAKVKINEAIEGFREVNHYKGISSGEALLERVYFLTGDYKKAYQYKQKSDSLKTRHYNKNIAYQHSEVETRYQTEKKEKLIETLRAEDAEKALEIQKKKIRNLILSIILFVALILISFLVYRNRKNKAELKQEQKRVASEIKTGQLLSSLLSESRANQKETPGLKDTVFHQFMTDNFKIHKIDLSEDDLKTYLQVAQDKSVKEIADALNLSPSGAKTRKHNLYEKLKMYRNTDESKMTQSQAIKFYHDLYIEYQTDRKNNR
jgi:tetratricopeptide (TPR) repeat protein